LVSSLLLSSTGSVINAKLESLFVPIQQGTPATPQSLPASPSFVLSGWQLVGQSDVPLVPDDVERWVRSNQRRDLGYLALGMIFIAIGLVALIVVVQRRKYEFAILYVFSAMSIFFGLRFLTNTYSMGFWMGGTRAFWDKTGIILGYMSGIAAFGFFRCYLGRGWHSSLSWVLWVYTAVACVSVPLIIVYTNPRLVSEISSVVVITCLAIIVANILRSDKRRTSDMRGLLTGSIASGLLVALDNLRGLGLILLPFRTEWAGMIVIYITLGLLTVRRLFTIEQRLIAVSQELETARRIQSSILPSRNPAIRGLAIATCYIPMTEVAGDFYDFIEVDDRHLGVLVADVSGHGVPAALIASMVKVAFQAQIAHASEPAKVLTGMKQTLSDQLGEQFVTAAYVYIDMVAGEMSYAGAAHPPLFIRSAGDGDVSAVEENGLMIGPFPEATYTSVKRRLSPGDRIVMYTDGIVETPNYAEEQFGDTRLKRSLMDCSQLTAEQYVDSLLAAVASWADLPRWEPAGDDLTLVVIDAQA
jgi:sigma-B regulation protein RsbU (phosphoserine phosphatase)